MSAPAANRRCRPPPRQARRILESFALQSHLGFMRLRRTLAVGVCLLMACVSSFAAICDLSCAMPHAHATQPANAAVMPAHFHCAHTARRGSSPAIVHRVSSHQNCSTAPCRQPLGSAVAAKAPVDISRTHGLVTSAAIDCVPKQRGAAGSCLTDAPQYHELSPHSLALVLRI